MSDEQPLNVEWTSVFKRDYKRVLKRNLDISLLDDIIGKLSRREPWSGGVPHRIIVDYVSG